MHRPKNPPSMRASSTLIIIGRIGRDAFYSPSLSRQLPHHQLCHQTMSRLNALPFQHHHQPSTIKLGSAERPEYVCCVMIDALCSCYASFARQHIRQVVKLYQFRISNPSKGLKGHPTMCYIEMHVHNTPELSESNYLCPPTFHTPCYIKNKNSEQTHIVECVYKW